MFFDVWVNGPALAPQEDPNRRSALLERVEALHPVAQREGAQFVAGARLRLRRGVDQDIALRLVAELQALGASVEVEANRPPDEAILALDQYYDLESEEVSNNRRLGDPSSEQQWLGSRAVEHFTTAPESEPVAAGNPAMLAQLQSLDGDSEAGAKIDREAETRAAAPQRTPGAAARGPAEPIAPVAKRFAHAAEPVGHAAEPVAPAPSRSRSPPSRSRSPPSRSRSPPSRSRSPTTRAFGRPAIGIGRWSCSSSVRDMRRCAPDQLRASVDGGVSASTPVAKSEQPVSGRIARGAPAQESAGACRHRRSSPASRSAGCSRSPYAHRAERRVAELRAAADRERYRPVDEAQARVRALDHEADDSANERRSGMALIWVVVGGAVFAGWWRAPEPDAPCSRIVLADVER